jgi:hypothetical protein
MMLLRMGHLALFLFWLSRSCVVVFGHTEQMSSVCPSLVIKEVVYEL